MKPVPVPANEADRLRLLHELRILDTETDPALQAIARLIQHRCARPIGAVSLVDADRQWFAAAAGTELRGTDRQSAFCAYTIDARVFLEVADARLDPRFEDNPLVIGTPFVRAYAAVPLNVDGQFVGTVCTLDSVPGALDAAAADALRDLARIVEALLDARLRAQRWRLQEARVRGASRAGSDWLWESDAEGVTTWVSGSVAEHTGEPPSRELGRRPLAEHRPRDDLHRASFEEWHAAVAERRPYRDAIAQRDTARGAISVAISGDPVFDSLGQFKGYRGAARSVTAELEREAKAQQDQQRLLDAIERVNAGVMVSDPAGRIVLSNASWRQEMHRFLPAGLPATWEQTVRALVRAGAYPQAAGQEEEFVGRRVAMVSDDGTHSELRYGERHVLVSDQRLPDGSVIHLSIDISERTRAEQARAEQQARLGALVRALPDLWLVLDRDGRYVECGDERHPLWTCDFAELRGRRIDEVMPPSLAQRGLAAIHAACAHGEVQTVDVPLAPVDPDSEHNFEARIAPMSEGRVLCLMRDMSELRQLARDVQLMQRALEAENSMPMSVVDATQPGLPLVYVNTGFERLTGYSRAEVLGRNCRFLQDGDHGQPGLVVLRAALAEGCSCTVQLRNRRRDGSHFINCLHIAPVHDAQHRITHYIGTQEDITERSAAEARLAYSEALYRSVAGAISEGLMVIDPERRIVTLNPSACMLLHTPSGDLAGLPLAQLGVRVRLEDGRPLEPGDDPLREVLHEHRRLERIFELERRDGSRVLLQVSLQPLRFGAPDAPAYGVATLRDIGAQRAAAAALAQSEARWNFALEGAGDGVWDYDEDSRVAYFSPTWKRLLGYADPEIGATLDEWWDRVHPDDRERVIGSVERYWRGEAAEHETQHRLRHKDGRWVWVRDRGRVVERRADGSARRLVGVHSDITRQRLADQALRDKQAAELASRAKSEFLSRMSHEMRTPLNAMIGFAQLLRLQGADDRQRLAQYTEHILQAGQHLLSLVNDVLDLQQVEEGRLSLQLVSTPLHAALEQALELVRPMARPRGIVVSADIPKGLRVRADAQRLRQVLLNVLSNGIKYNRDGGSLRCSLDEAGAGRCVLRVEDSGRGLDRDQLARLFQPFERLGLETSGIEGSGLGLIIARQLMREMGGDLRLNSRPGVGTQVRIEIPALTDGAAVAPLPDSEAPTTTAWNLETRPAPEPTLAPLRMLYVEDNRINALLFEEAIKLRGGIDLRIAEDGEEALALVAQWTPQVLVLDAHLPGMSGYELLVALRALDSLAAVPAFMCSADAMPDDVQRAEAAGFIGYWTKPIDVARVMKDLDALRQTPAG